MSAAEGEYPRTCTGCRGSGTVGRDAFGKPTGSCSACGGTGQMQREDDLRGPAWAECPLGCGMARMTKRLYVCGTTVMGDPPTGTLIDRGRYCEGQKPSTRERAAAEATK